MNAEEYYNSLPLPKGTLPLKPEAPQKPFVKNPAKNKGLRIR